MPEPVGWTRPAWTTWSGDELRAHLELMQAYGESYFHLYEEHRPGHRGETDEPRGDLYRSAWSPELRVWRNAAMPGQAHEVPMAEHMELASGAFGGLEDFRYEDVVVHPHPGGFTFEATSHFTADGGHEMTLHVVLVVYVDDDGHVVRIHEYMDSAESERVQTAARA